MIGQKTFSAWDICIKGKVLEDHQLEKQVDCACVSYEKSTIKISTVN